MSYFMTVCGKIPGNEIAESVELLPASKANPYIASIENKLIEEDGYPVFLVHDLETGTSDLLISELQDAIFEGHSLKELAAYRFLQHCFFNAIPFRIWLASNGADDYKSSPIDVKNIDGVCEAINSGRGAKWSPLSDSLNWIA